VKTQRKKRINPHHRPATLADVKKAKSSAVLEATTAVSAIMLITLLDKYGFSKHVQAFWADVNKLSEEITEGYLSIADIKRTLKEEYGIAL